MLKMNFGRLCTAVHEVKRRDVWVPPKTVGVNSEIKEKMSQVDAVNLLYSMVLTDEDLDKLPDITPRDASYLFCNNRAVHKQIQKQAWSVPLNLVQNNLYIRLLDFMNDEEKHALWNRLQNLLRETPLGDDPFNLGLFEGEQYSEKNFCFFMATALLWCLQAPNTKADKFLEDGSNRWPLLPDDIEHYDPHSLSKYRAGSTAICFKLINNDSNAEKLFFCQERVLEYVLGHSLIITKFDFCHNTIRIFYNHCHDKALHLTRVEKQDFQQASNFIRDNLDKFKPKLSWRRRLLSDMALIGLEGPKESKELHRLKYGKWTAFAFYNDRKEIVCFLDYKLRSDCAIELGIQLTAESYQNLGLATGLINLFRLMFMNNRLFAGTFEENDKMRHVLEKCGFQPHYFFDPVTQLLTNKIRERIDVYQPDNQQAMTNSVYYFANSLLGQFCLNEMSTSTNSSHT